ncbi:MAG: filamentous hemagglutinin N-terminal domain-containing protein, partial [Gallionellaceae bacterium]|nr:filamentous hemagglutinin N-terminal domain-containing protein [Gallionellaceae bacterium]
MRKNFIRKVALVVLTCFTGQSALFANPLGGVVASGQASIAAQGNVLTVTNTPNAIINWQSFSINPAETTRFVQQSASSSVLNRVLGPDPSQLLGTLTSNGRVFLINPAGILVGQGARIDVAGFVASTLHLSNADFLAGKLNFTNPSPAGGGAGVGGVVNNGSITTPSGGTVYLIAPQVTNAGFITTPQGETILAAGDTVQLIDTGTPGVSVQVTGANNNATNLGQILADSGRIGMVAATLKNSGTLSASSLVNQGGRVFLKAANRVETSGAVTANGITGGTIEVLGNETGVMDGATVSANGAQGGGTVLIGGDYQGKNPAVQNARVTYVAATATISADATDSGNGGKVIVWADDTTRAYGNISARGGANGGNGGFVETSGKNYLDVGAIQVDRSAPAGKAGTWLLDPTNITIMHSVTPAEINMTGVSPFQANPPTASSSQLSDYTINQALSSGNVIVTTSSSGTASGDITFDALLGGAIVVSNPASAGRTLNFNADRDIKFVGGSTIFQSSPSTSILDVVLNPVGKVTTVAGSSVTLDGNLGLTRAWVALAKTWENFGTLSLTNNAALHIEHNYGAGASTLHNMSGGIVNVASTQGWAIWSNSCCQDGIITNDGTFNVTASTAFEAAYSQSSSGMLNIADTKFLNLQNAIALSGGVNLNATGALSINENHGTAASLSNLTFSGTGGALNVSATKTANLSNVSASNVALTVDTGGIINVVNGNTVFKTVSFLSGGTLGAMTNGTLGIASGNFSVPTGVAYTGNIGYSAAGNLTIPTGANISTSGNLGLTAGATLGITDAQVVSGGNMAVNVGGNLNLTATSSFTQLGAYGTQVINFTGAGAAHLMNIQGGNNSSYHGASASVESASLQTINYDTTGGSTLDILVAGGSAVNNANNSYVYVNNIQTATLVCTACATWNWADIGSMGGQNITATTITVNGGVGATNAVAGNGNYANIQNKSTSVAQTITTTGTISLTGGTAPGFFNPAYPNDGVGNEAGIHSDGLQTIHAGSIALSGGGDANTLGGAFLTGKAGQNITTTGGLSMTGGLSAAAGQYGLGTPAIIGEQYSANITLNVGGNLAMTGGSGSASPALIGAAGGTPGITITAADISMTAGVGAPSKIGVLTGDPAGTLSMTATTGNISQDASSGINTDSLSASANAGAINFSGPNLVNTLTTLSASGNIAYVSAGDISLGLLSSATGGVSVTANGAIYDNNGVGINNITASNIYLTSTNGGLPGQLAISADTQVAAGGSIAADISYGSYYGGIRIYNVGATTAAADAPGWVSLADYSLNGGPVAFTHVGDIGTSTGIYASTNHGDIAILVRGTLTESENMSLSTPDSALIGATGDMYMTCCFSTSGNLGLAAGNLLDISGSVYAGGDLLLVAPTLNITGSTHSSLNTQIIASSM